MAFATTDEFKLLNNPDLFYDISSTTVKIFEDLEEKKENPIKMSKYLKASKLDILFDYIPCFSFMIDKYNNKDSQVLKTLLFTKSNNKHYDLEAGSTPEKNNNKKICLILVHGFASRQKKIYLQLAQRIASRDIDCILYTLPFHFERSGNGSAISMEIKDFRFTLELFRQSVIELRIIVNLLKKRGYDRVGVLGFSFGGYCTSILSCFESNLDFAIPMASIGDFGCLWIYKKGRSNLSDSAEIDRINRFFSENYVSLICPISFYPVVKTKNIVFIQGLFDNRAPIGDVLKLRKKWGDPRVIWYPCGHFAFFAFNRLTVKIAENFIKRPDIL